ncbi:MAG: SPFH domain-containing protein [Deltaproteobacteria bacterium]|nr:SPFH domain-containing protein [Deltaproteobacteria bacterium]
MGNEVFLVGAGVVGFLMIVLVASSIYTVEQRTVAIVQRLGKFQRAAEPGIHLKIPVLDRVVGRINVRVQQLDVAVDTKTEDNVFVNLMVAVQYYVLPDKVYDAFYKLDDARRQITSYVFDVVRAQVPNIKLDDVFAKKDDIAEAVKVELSHVMENFGYGILKALVTDIEPDARVKEAMNEINAAQRMRFAANEKGEAERILKVKLAEGDAQSKALQGKGIADQRQAIVAGLRDSVDEFRRSVPGTTAKDVMNLVLMTQYFDMLKEIGASARSTAILIPHSPGNLTSLTEQIRNAMIEADQVTDHVGETARPAAAAHPAGNGHARNT